MRKKGQSWSLESYIAVGIFLFALIFFYALITFKSPQKTLQDEANIVTDNLLSTDYFSDNVITYEEAQLMSTWNCSRIKEELKTTKEVCIYFTDEHENLIPINSSPPNPVYAIGCPGINVSNNPCNSTP